MLAVVERMPVLKEVAIQKSLRIEALEKRLKGVAIMPFTSSIEFLRAKQDQDIDHVFE
ncbi:MAG: hypothetical protein RQ714_05200 [Nitrosomonas sp.]|nr:hypothetical protein [Nitrosomonas sp.]